MKTYLVEKRFLFRVKANSEDHAVERVDDPDDPEGEVLAHATLSVTETEESV